MYCCLDSIIAVKGFELMTAPYQGISCVLLSFTFADNKRKYSAWQNDSALLMARVMIQEERLQIGQI